MKVVWVGAHTNNYRAGRNGNKVDKIVLHWIVGTLESCDATFQKPDRIASAHYGIGDDEVHQYVKEEDTAYHAGNWSANQTSVGIEHEGGWLLADGTTRFKPTQKIHQTSANLVRELADRYSIPLDRSHIRRHQEVSDKPTACPGLLDVDLIISLAKNSIIEPIMNDQTKIPIGGDWGTMEVQQIRSKLNDQKRDIDNLRGTVKGLSDESERNKVEIKELKDKVAGAEEGLRLLGKKREELEERVKKLEENVNEPVFQNPIAKLFYSLAKSLEGK